MRTMQAALACLLAAAIAALPAAALTAATSKTASEKAASSKASRTASKAVAPAAPAAAPASPAVPALPPLAPPLPPVLPAAPATEPGLAAPAAGPLTPGMPAAAPVLPPLPPLPAAATTTPAKPAAVPAVPPEGEPPPSAPKHAFPYSGFVNAEAVRIRSGPGLYYYPLATVNGGIPVVVEGEAEGWLALRPTESVYGLVKKSEVEMSPDGKKANVSAPSARIYTASDSANRHWCVMTTLKQGDALNVLGPGSGDFVKVAPPEDARIYVVAQYVTAGQGPSGIGAALAQMSQPPKVDPMFEEFKKTDTALEEEMKKPMGDRDFKALAAAFKDIADKAEKHYLKRAALDRLALVQNFEEQQAGYLRVLAIGDRLDKRLADIKAQEAAKAAEAERDKRLAKADFAATGMVQKLESLEDVDYPIKYKLVDQNNHPLVVLASSTYDLAKYVGKVVGVRGAKTYLKDWRIYLVTVDDLEVLE